MTTMPNTAGTDRAAFGLTHFLELPRVSGLVLSPDGRRLIATVATPSKDGKKFVSSLWELDPAGERQPRRLTRSAPGESGAAFLPDGSLLFTSARPDPEADDTDEVSALWLLPAGGGEARPVLSVPGGVTAVETARDSGTIALVANACPRLDSLDEDRELAKAREDAGVGAVLFESYPIRFWDHYLGPRAPRLFAAQPPPAEGRIEDPVTLTPGSASVPGQSLDEASFSVTPDGAMVVTTWETEDDPHNPRARLVAIDVAKGDRRILFDDQEATVGGVTCSPDGRWVACERMYQGSPDTAPDVTLLLIDLSSGEARDLLPDFELWPGQPTWTPDSRAVLFVADQRGHTPVFRIDLDGGITRLCAEGSFSDLCPAPDGNTLYALRASISSPPQAVALSTAGADQRPEPLPTPGVPLEVPSSVTEVTAAAADGVVLRAWLVLPEGTSPARPAPLLTFIHGGPLSSWSGWHWRWNPHLLAARGYAVLLPDPALSTGYGQAFVGRGRGRWGEEPYTDLLALIDAAEARPDIDQTRTAAMGGSFGGYMANWIAGQTDRFRCIVTHASIWSLEQFRGTTDSAAYWEREFGSMDKDPARYRDNSPDRQADAITTPMLVIHGERDYRVPVGEALRLWTDLKLRGVEAKLLYFPDENHWILKPSNARVWYETVFAFLDQHVLGRDWVRPNLL